MAAADRFWVNITGRGGHAAMPHLSIDPVIAASQVGSRCPAGPCSTRNSCHATCIYRRWKLCLQEPACKWRLAHLAADLLGSDVLCGGLQHVVPWKAFVHPMSSTCTHTLCDVPSASTLRRCRTCSLQRLNRMPLCRSWWRCSHWCRARPPRPTARSSPSASSTQVAPCSACALTQRLC